MRERGWCLFDQIIESAPGRDTSPWALVEGRVTFVPDYDTLSKLLGVPVYLNATSQSGVPALALDVWVSYEMRRAGFDADKVWPRASEPRVFPYEIHAFVESLPAPVKKLVRERISGGKVAGAAKSANLLGKNYVKQVDVVMSSWATGPELMISTKRMDSSFGKNAANRVEESYGDAKNLRLRHPQAALGFVYALNAIALSAEHDKAMWLIDLLQKLGREDDAYDAVALVMPDLVGDDEQAGTEEPDESPRVRWRLSFNARMDSMAAPRKYPAELQERATRLAIKARQDPERRRGAVRRVAEQLGVNPETLRNWVSQAEVDAGTRPGVTTSEHERLLELERENRELRRANAILRSASAFFAAELDRPHH